MRMKVVCSMLLVSLFAIAGCDGGNARVSGTVKFADGLPYTGGRVLFEQGGISAVGFPDADGRFELYMAKPGDGVKPGKYTGFIANDPPMRQEGSAFGAAPAPPFAAKYSDPKTSGLSLEVKAGEKKTIAIVLDAQ